MNTKISTRERGQLTLKGLRKLTLTLAAVIAAAGMLAAEAPAAQAATARNGICEAGEFCYYYNSNQAGSVSDFSTSLGDYGTSQPSCYEFRGPGAGYGLCLKNQAASVWNRSSQTVRVFYNSNYAGAYQDFAPGASGNLSSTLKNNNAAHMFISTPAPAQPTTSRQAQLAAWQAWALNPANWKAKTDGGLPGIDQDGAYGAQCADLGRSWAAYISKLVGFDGNDTYTSSKTGWTKTGTNLSLAQPGDVITHFLGIKHVVVVVAGPVNGMITVIEQNPSSPHISKYAITSAGYIWRP